MPATPRTGSATGPPKQRLRARVVPSARAGESDFVHAWRRLAAGPAHPNPFLGPDMLLPALEHLPGGDDVDLLVVESRSAQEDALRLLLPLRSGHRLGRAPGRPASTWEHPHLFLGTPLTSPSLDEQGWRVALDCLQSAARETWLVLPSVDLDVASTVEAAAHAQGRTTRRLPVRERAFGRRRPEADYLEATLSGRSRKNLRRRRRRLAEEVGELSVVDLVARDGVRAAAEQFLSLEAAGWKGADGGAFAANPGERAFFVEACAALAEQDAVWIIGLVGADGRPLAIAVDVADGPGLFTFKLAYDEAYARYSPGTLLAAEHFAVFHASDQSWVDSCSAPDNESENRLYAERRALTTVLVQLRGRRGAWAVRLAPRVLAGVVRAKRLVAQARSDRGARDTDHARD